MPLEQSDKDFLTWADGQLKANGANSVPSNFDRLRSRYLINSPEDTTWGAIYDRAFENYIDSGGNEAEAAILAPNKAKSDASKKKKKDLELETRTAIDDPFGSNINKYKISVTTDPDNGRTYVSGITDKDGTAAEHFFYTGYGPSSAYVGSTVTNTKDKQTVVTYKYDDVRKLVLEDTIKDKTDGLLFDSLYQNGLISKEIRDKKDISSQEFNKALQYSLRNYSIDSVDKYSLQGIKEAQTFMDYLTKGGLNGSLKASSRTTYDSVITKRSDAADDADQFYMTWVGRGAYKSEEDDYYAVLRAAEKKHVVSTTSQYDSQGNRTSSTQTGEGLTQEEKLLLIGKVASKSLAGTDIGKILSSGANAAREISTIKTYANSYGVRLSDEDAVKYVADNLDKGQDSKTSKNKLLAIAKGQYQNLSNLIDDSVSISDLATNYRYNYEQTLEVSPDAVDVFDPHIQSALMNNGKTGMMSLTDFNKVLRQDSRWAKTKNAKEEASKYAYDILNSFGLMA
jgi:hypothetical protein